MAKLNKQEVNAIACDIYDRINASIIKHNENVHSKEAFAIFKEEFEKTKEFKKLSEAFDKIKEISKLLEAYNTSSNWGSVYNCNATTNCTLDEIIKYKFKKDRELLPLKGNIDSIEREIIISQARSESIDAIIQQLIEKYS